MTLKIAILIPVYNGLNYLKNSLPLIHQQINRIEKFKFHIVVIDDNSSDGTDIWLKTNYPDILVLHGDGSLWWSGGINMGVRHVLADQDYDFVLLWNHDTVCAGNYFSILAEVANKYHAKSMIASKIFFLAEPETIFNMGAFFNPKTGKISLNGYGRKDSDEFSQPVEVDWTGGMGTLIPVEVFQQIGLFDQQNFPQYYGDSDFFLRAKAFGFKLIAIPELKIWNDKSSSGLEHKNKWSLFFRSLSSTKSNRNIVIEYKFLRRHCNSLFFLFFFILRILKYFVSFFKQWFLSLFK